MADNNELGQIFDIQEPGNVATLLNTFNFHNGARIADINISAFVLPLARAWENIAPIPRESIKIFYAGEHVETIRTNSVQALAMMLQAGTKPFNAILYAGVCAGEQLGTFGNLFDLETCRTPSIIKQNKAISILAAAIIVLYTRGSLPGGNNSSLNQRLPNFVINMLANSNITTEIELRNAMSDFDPKHLNVHAFMGVNSYAGWNEVVANRLNLGVAGHKPIKAIADLAGSFVENTVQADLLCSRLRTAERQLNAGFYLSLHPAYGTLARAYPKFYLNCLKSLFNCLNGTDSQKYALMASLPYFRNERAIIDKKLHLMSNQYVNWNYERWGELLGAVNRFTSDTRDNMRVEPVHLIVEDDFEVQEEDLGADQQAIPVNENL